MLPYPEGTHIDISDGVGQVVFRIPERYPYLDGHFPGNPIVPAVAQIGWVLVAGEALLGIAVTDYRLSRFKFLRPTRPNDEVRLVLTINGAKVAVELYVNDELSGSGTLVIVSHD